MAPQTRPVDMGLPSGLLWSPVNVDASELGGFARSAYQYGCSYVSWGNVEPHNPMSGTAFDYNWGGINAESPWYDGQVYGDTVGSTLQSNISAENDAARAICGGLWRLPSVAEFTELINNCDFIDADGVVIGDGVTDKRIEMPSVSGQGSVVGVRLRSKSNGRILFLPACGLGSGRNVNSKGVFCYYWASSYESEKNAYSLAVLTNQVDPRDPLERRFGLPIRPVMMLPG